MTKLDLLDIISDARDAYVREALETRGAAAGKTRRISMKRTMLIAAIVAILLLLVGCVAMCMTLRDLSIGQETYVPKTDEYGQLVEPTEKLQDILTLTSFSGSPVQMALQEWYAFCESYDPNGELLGNESDLPDIPNNYEYIYSCYTQEMVDKLDEIAEKYNLNLLDDNIAIQQWQSQAALEFMGLDSLLQDTAEVKHMSGMYYSPGNFFFDVQFQLTDESAAWQTPVSGRVYYSRKDYMVPLSYLPTDLEDYEQWTYTTSDGTQLLLALGSRGGALLITEREDAVIGISLTISANHLMSENGAAPTKEAVEQLAEAFDYQIAPSVSDYTAMKTQLEELDEAYWEQQKPTAVASYDGFSSYFQENAVEIRKEGYTFFDVDGDGKQDLLIGDAENGISICVAEREEGLVPFYLGNTWLLENGGTMTGERGSNHAIYYEPVGDGQYLHLSQNEEESNYGEHRFSLLYLNDGLCYCKTGADGMPEETPISEEDALALRAEYPVVELDWTPVLEYALDTGETVGDYLNEIDVRLPEEELIKKYQELTKEIIDFYEYCRFNLMDINGDGVLDLLLTSDSMTDINPDSGNFYWSAYTYRYGTLLKFPVSDFYLCEDNVLEDYGLAMAENGRKIYHTFVKLEGEEKEILEPLIYYQGTDTWYLDETQISEEEANAILAKYPRIDQEMRPISELYN